MLAKDSLITFLRYVDGIVPRRGRTDVFIFGSGAAGETCDDVDLLIVYDQDIISVREALSLRENVATAAQRASIPVDISLLSAAESNGNPFLAEEGCKSLAPWLASH